MQRRVKNSLPEEEAFVLFKRLGGVLVIGDGQVDAAAILVTVWHQMIVVQHLVVGPHDGRELDLVFVFLSKVEGPIQTVDVTKVGFENYKKSLLAFVLRITMLLMV